MYLTIYRGVLSVFLFSLTLTSCKNDSANASNAKVVNKSSSSEAAALPNISPLQSQNVTDATVSSLKTKVTTMSFEKLSYDWGTIKEGEKMTHVFKFKNTGKEDLIISEVRPSCGCTTPEWPKTPTKPNAENEISVVFDSKNKSNDVIKTVAVTANTEPAVTTLVIKGKVTPN